MKQQILSEIQVKLAAMSLPMEFGNVTDISVNKEFLDASWSTGRKNIAYQALIFANEQDNVIYMYEKTTEKGQGFSFGGFGGSSFQSGKTLFRKVKSVQYGPEGKVYEINIDLGAIPKAVKESAIQYGWKFKTVLSTGKATYPAGYVNVFTGRSQHMQQTQQPQHTQQEQQQQAQQPQQASNQPFAFCTACGNKLNPGAKFCNKCGNPTVK